MLDAKIASSLKKTQFDCVASGLQRPDWSVTPLPSSIIFPAVACPKPQGDDAKFRERSKRAEDGPSRAGRLSKTFPEVPMVSRVSSGNPESRLRTPLGLGIIEGIKVWLGSWDAPEPLACSWSKKFSCVWQAVHFVRKSWIWVKSWLAVEGFLSSFIDNSSILACLPRSVSSQQILLNSSISWQSLARVSRKNLLFISNSPRKLIFSLWVWSFHWFAWCSSISESRVLDWFLCEQCQHFFVPNKLLQCLHQFQIIVSELCTLLEQPLELSCWHSMFRSRKSFLDFLRNFQWRNSWENIPLEFEWFSIDSQQFCLRSGHFEFFHLTFLSHSCISVFILLVQTQFGIRADTYFCLRPLDHLIMRQYWSRPWRRGTVNRMHIQNFFRMVQISISVWHWTSSEFPRVSCRLTDSPNNVVQDEWLLSLTKIWTFAISTHWSLMLQMQILSTLLQFPTSCAKKWKTSVTCWQVCVLHILKLCPWSHCPYKFPCTSGVRRFLPVSLLPGIWILSIILSPHMSTFDFWALDGPYKFPSTSLTA